MCYLQMEERARLIIMKKKRNDQRGGRSMERVASGIAMKASPIDCYIKQIITYLSRLILVFYRDYTVNISSISKVTENSKDYEASKERGEGVADTDNECVTIAVVVELIVAGQGELTPVSN